MRALLLVLLLSTPLLAGTAAEAQTRKPQEFVAPQQMSEEELAASKARMKVDEFGRHEIPKEEPIPWRAMALLGIVAILTLPFGIKVYRNTSKELVASNSFGMNNRDDEA